MAKHILIQRLFSDRPGRVLPKMNCGEMPGNGKTAYTALSANAAVRSSIPASTFTTLRDLKGITPYHQKTCVMRWWFQFTQRVSPIFTIRWFGDMRPKLNHCVRLSKCRSEHSTETYRPSVIATPTPKKIRVIRAAEWMHSIFGTYIRELEWIGIRAGTSSAQTPIIGVIAGFRSRDIFSGPAFLPT